MGQEEILHKHKCKKTFSAFAKKEINMSKIKLLSFVLVVAMVFTFMAMSVSAATTVIQPRGTCPQCVNGYVSTTTKPSGSSYGDYQTTCSNMSVLHRHYKQKYVITATCRNCGYIETTSYVKDCCIYG